MLWLAAANDTHAAGCGPGSGLDCDHVLQSRWSQWLGMPVSLPAVGIYLLLLIGLLAASPDSSEQNQAYAWRLLLALAIVAGGSGLWFIGLQAFVLRSFCPYCLLVHCCGLLLLAFVAALGPIRFRRAKRRADPLLIEPARLWQLTAVASSAVALLIAGQLFVEPAKPEMEIAQVSGELDSEKAGPRGGDLGEATGRHGRETMPQQDGEASSEQSREALPEQGGETVLEKAPERANVAAPPPGPKHRRVALLGQAASLDAYEQPLIGSPDASYIVVEMFDYTCSHCRTLHRYLKQAHERYGEQLAVVVLCVPMNTSCNKFIEKTTAPHVHACTYARLALAVWHSEPTQFEEFHNWLLDGSQIPSPPQARAKAIELIGQDALETVLYEPRVDRHLESITRIFKQVGAGPVPKMIYDRVIANGEPANAQKLFDFFEHNVGLRPLLDK